MNKIDFDSIFKEYNEPVFRLCLGYFGGHHQLADDTCQEIFIKIWQNSDRFKGQSKVSTWIYRIAVNTCINVLRSAKYKRQLKELDINAQHEKQDDSPTSEQVDEKEDQLRSMYNCISKLEPKDRSIILLVLDQEPYENIADIIGITENNLRVKIHRIKDKLSKCVKS
jgi:RNA polymerase sigma-70 factor (ECF subfamily)